MLGEIVFLRGLIRFLLSQKHYLSILLSLELIVLSLYFLYVFSISMLEGGGEIIFLFLTMFICEGAFGLCLMIYLSRGYGCDIFNYTGNLS